MVSTSRRGQRDHRSRRSSASFSLATIDDALAEAQKTLASASPPPRCNFENSSSAHSTEIGDNDASRSVLPTPALSEAGGSITYTASVTQAPVSDLTLTLSNGAVITILAGQTSGSASVVVDASDDVYLDRTASAPASSQQRCGAAW